MPNADAWFDAVSRSDSLEPGSPAAADDAGSLLGDAPAAAPGPAAWLPPQPPCRRPHDGPHVPSPPLQLADREYVFVPVPRVTGFAGYWLKDQERTTQGQPIDVMLGSTSLATRAHDSIPGIWVRGREGARGGATRGGAGQPPVAAVASAKGVAPAPETRPAGTHEPLRPVVPASLPRFTLAALLVPPRPRPAPRSSRRAPTC
jgi:hypothetical protein